MDVVFEDTRIPSEVLRSNMSTKTPKYECPNIVIVPTVSFIHNKNGEPSAKKQKVETSESFKETSDKIIPSSSSCSSSNTSQENLNDSSSSTISQEHLNEASKKSDVNSNKKEIKVNSWASNYLNSIGMNTKPIKMNLSISKNKILEKLAKAAEKKQDDSVKLILIDSSKDNVCSTKDESKTNTKENVENVCPAKDEIKTDSMGNDASRSNPVENNVYPINSVPKTDVIFNTNNVDSSNISGTKPLLYQFSALIEAPVNVIKPSENQHQKIEPQSLHTYPQNIKHPQYIEPPISHTHLKNIEPPNLHTHQQNMEPPNLYTHQQNIEPPNLHTPAQNIEPVNFDTANVTKYDEYINSVPGYCNNNYQLNHPVFTPNYYEYTYNIIEQQLYAMEKGPRYHNQISSDGGINHTHPTSHIFAKTDREYRDFYVNSQTSSKNTVSDYDFQQKPIIETKRRKRYESDSSYSDATIDQRRSASHDNYAKHDCKHRDFYVDPKITRNIDSDNISKDKHKTSKTRQRRIFSSDSSCSDVTADGHEKKYQKMSSKRRRSESRSPYKKVKEINRKSKPVQKYKERSHSPIFDKRKQSERRSSRSESYKKRYSVESKISKYTPEKSKLNNDKEKRSTKERHYEEKSKYSKTKVPRSRTPECEQNKRARKDSENLNTKTKPTPMKSVVQPNDNFQAQHGKSPSPEHFDLRSKLSRANKFHENGVPSKSTDTAMDKIRDNLLVTINQPVNTTEPKAKAPSKIKVAEKKSKGKKFKTIQFTIKVLCDDGSSSVSEESGEEINSGDEPGVQRDLSFLDDFNIDEIVDSLKNTRRNAQKGKNSPRIIEKTVPKKEVENSSVILESIKTENIKVKEESNDKSQDCIILEESDINIKQEQIDEFNKSNDCVILGTVPKPIKIIKNEFKSQAKKAHLSGILVDSKTKQTSTNKNNESNDCVIVDLIKTEKIKHENIHNPSDCLIIEQSVENIKIETDSNDDNTSTDCIIVDQENTTEIKVEVVKDTVEKEDRNKSDDCIIIEPAEPIIIEPNNNKKERLVVRNVEVNESTYVNKHDTMINKEAGIKHAEIEITQTAMMSSNDVSKIPLPNTPNSQESINGTILQKATSLEAHEVLKPYVTKEIKQELIDKSIHVTQDTTEPTATREHLHRNCSIEQKTAFLEAKDIKQELINESTNITQDTNESTTPKKLLYISSINESIQQEIPTPLATKEIKQELIDENVTQHINEFNALKNNIPLMSTPAPQKTTNETTHLETLTLLATKEIKKELIDEISSIAQKTTVQDELLNIPLPENNLTNHVSEKNEIVKSNHLKNGTEDPLSKEIKEVLFETKTFKSTAECYDVSMNDTSDLFKSTPESQNNEGTINNTSYDSDASTVKLQYDSDDEETVILNEVEDIEMEGAIDEEIKLLENEESEETKETKEPIIEEKEVLIEATKHIKQQTKVMIEVTVPMEVELLCENTNSSKLDTNAKPHSPILDIQPKIPETIMPENICQAKMAPEISKQIKQELIESEPQPPKKEIPKPNQQGVSKTGTPNLKEKETSAKKADIVKSSEKEASKLDTDKLNQKGLQNMEIIKPNTEKTGKEVTNTETVQSNKNGALSTEIAKSSLRKEVFKPDAKETPIMEIAKSDPKNAPKMVIAKPIQKEPSKMEITKQVVKEAPKTEISKSSQQQLPNMEIAKPVQKVSPKKEIVFNQKEAPKTETKTNSKIKTEESERQVTVVKNSEIQQSEFKETKKKLEDRMYEYLHDRHTIISLIHSGRFSNIYRCHDSKKRHFVVKMIREQSNRLSLGVEKEHILQELQRDIPKENIHTVFMVDSFGIDRHWAFLMEYYPTDLKNVLDRRSQPFTICQVQELAGQLITALMVLRNNNIVHSDIKPAHILMNESQNKIKLCGFDSSYYEDRVNVLPNIGTLSYRAPEVIIGFSASFGIDVWSTAVVLYEMFTKRRLFGGVYNNTILFNQLCLFGDMPPDMIQRSAFKANHFNGVHFLKRSGHHGSKVQIVYKFHKTPKFYRYIFTTYEHFWGSRTMLEKANDMVKLYGFYKLLEQMLVIDPRKRLTIEFVCTDPFITDMMYT